MDDLKTTAKKLRLPLESTPEGLACDWRHTVKTWKVHAYALFRLEDGQLPEVTIENIQAETAEEALQIAANHFDVTADGNAETVSFGK